MSKAVKAAKKTKEDSGHVRTLLSPNTSIGQHFLKNPAIVDAIVTKSHILKTDTVLEVGPGTGELEVYFLKLTNVFKFFI
jgi:18S rRNA (adenine1779-N6/adenine1780-N6)-dimethyltransferase